MSNQGRIPPPPDMPPAGTEINFVKPHVGKNGCWRMLTDQKAYVLRPVCDPLAQPVTELPPCEKFDVVACRWGYPDFEQTHLDEYSALKRRFLAGDFPHWKWAMVREKGEPSLDELPKFWQQFLSREGNDILWQQVADDEMRGHWLVPDGDRNPAQMLALFARETPDKRKTVEATVTRTELESIRYAANFVAGDKLTVVYLSEFVRDSLTVEEMPHTPGHEKRQGQIRAENMAIAVKMEKNFAQGEAVAEKLMAAAGEVRKASEIGDWYSNPSMADAKNAAIKRGVPKEFVVYCFKEMHLRKFPSTGQAYKAVCELPLFRACRDPETPSDTTVWRNWWKPVREELEKRGLLAPRGKGKSAKRAASYDVGRHPDKQPGDVTLEDAEEERLRAGKTDRDSRTNELPDEPESFDLPDRPGLH